MTLKFKKDKFLLLKNTGNGVRLMIDNEGDTFNHINKSLVSVVVTIHIFSSPNRKIVLQGQAKDGSIVNLWVKKTSPQFKLHVISFQVNLQGLTALWWQSDAQQVGIGDLSITTILTPSTLCDFSTGTICDLETEANPEDYEIRRDFTFQTDREDLHHIPWNWDAQAEKEQSMMKDREQKYLTLTDGSADVLQQSPPLSYLVVRNRKLIRLSWPLKNIKDFKKRRQMNFEFLYYKKFETQSKVRLFVQTDVGLKIIWDSFHEAAFERHPWRAVLASLNVETVQLVRSWFEIEGDNLNALSQIYRSITFHVNLNPLRSSFQISLNYFERLQAPYSGGFLVGPLLLQDPSVLSLRRTQLNYNLLAYADFTGPFAPNHTGQLACNEKVAANHMELLSQPLHVDYRSEGCIEMEVVIWTNTSNEDQIDSPQTPAFELNINLLYSHREQRLARLFTTNEKLGRLYIPVHFIDQGRILFQAIRLQSERYGMIGVRNFAYFPGNCSKLKWFRLKNSKTITPANRTNVAALRDISCDFTSDFCGWRNDPNLGRWQSWKGNAETREKWKTSISKDSKLQVLKISNNFALSCLIKTNYYFLGQLLSTYPTKMSKRKIRRFVPDSNRRWWSPNRPTSSSCLTCFVSNSRTICNATFRSIATFVWI